MNSPFHLASVAAHPQPDPAAVIRAIEAESSRHETPSGTGAMVWRRWGDGPPVVLLHGGAGAWAHWIRNIGPLAEHHTVWVPDIPGHGESVLPEPLELDSICDAVEHGMRSLIPDGLIDVVAFSFGSTVATRVGQRLGDRLGHLILLANCFVADFARVFPTLVSWREIEDPIERRLAHQRNLEIMMIADPAKVDPLAIHIQSTFAPLARFHPPKLTRGNKVVEFLPGIRASRGITAICGSEDRNTKVVMERQEASLKEFHPEARFHCIHGAGHWVQYEQAERINPLLLDTLSNRTTGQDQGAAIANASPALHGAIPDDPQAAIAMFEAQCTRHLTPCSNGSIVWRRWGQGPNVVLFHGGSGAWSHWIRNIGPLSRHHTVWAPDNPGLGESALPEPLTLETIVDALESGLRTLIPEGPVDIVGFSFGGPIATGVAMKLESRLRNLVLLASRYVVGYKRFYPRLVVWKEIADPVARLEAHRRNLEMMMMSKPENIDALAVHIQSTNAARARYFGPKLNPGNKLLEWLPQVRPSQRVTGICGRDDQGAMGIIDQQETALQAIHPNGRFYAIDDAGHWVQYEAADRVNAILLETLSGKQ